MLENIPIIPKFLNVFPVESLVKPPNQEIEFIIEFIFDTVPILKTPYWIALAKLKELKAHL